MDYKFYNEVNQEDKQYRKWVREQENKILARPSMSLAAAQRKQDAWNALHLKFEVTGEIINSPVY